MNSGATAERVFAALKSRIMDHDFRPGDHLDPAVLAHELASSVTPVRDALNRLTGEGLVETRMGGGFHLPSLDEPGLKDLYGWSAELLSLAIRGWPRASPTAALVADSGSSIADQAAQLFLAVGRASANCEHARAIEQLNSRLHAVRGVEPRILANTDIELEACAAALDAGDREELRRLCSAYHRRRARSAAEIVRAAYRP